MLLCRFYFINFYYKSIISSILVFPLWKLIVSVFQAWKLWKEEIVSPLIDSTISDPIFRNEILRCIHIGLLCVQEFVQDRPSMSAVISMLNSEILDLPAPKQPGFTGRQFTTDTESSQQNQEITCSVNKVTITCVEGR